MTRVTVYEYPKSGGSWLVNLLGDLLGLPRRDIYVKDGFQTFAIEKHPWYIGQQSLNVTDECVIKSHELPGSALNVSGKAVHLIRDGRDVAVSKYLFEKDFCVKNGIYKSFEMGFDEYLTKTANEWRLYIEAWLKQEEAVVIKYEDLLQSPALTMEQLLYELGERPRISIEQSFRNNSKENMRKDLGKVFQFNTFVRKGIQGDWVHHFQESHKALFKEAAGGLLIELGYENDSQW